MARLEIPVEGMHCAGCARTLSLALGRLEGVRSAKVDFAAGRARVSFDPERVDERALLGIVEACGFIPVVEEVS